MKNLSKKALWGIIGAAAVVIAVIVLVVAETVSGGHLHIVNNTNKDINKVAVSFYDEEQDMIVDWLFEDSVAAGDKVNYKYDGYYDFTGMYCTCDVDVEFAGYKSLFVYDGGFSRVFKGNIDLTFTEEDGEIYLTMKGYEGIFKSTKGSHLDSKFRLDLENGYFEDEDGDWEFEAEEEELDDDWDVESWELEDEDYEDYDEE